MYDIRGETGWKGSSSEPSREGGRQQAAKAVRGKSVCRCYTAQPHRSSSLPRHHCLMAASCVCSSVHLTCTVTLADSVIAVATLFHAVRCALSALFTPVSFPFDCLLLVHSHCTLVRPVQPRVYRRSSLHLLASTSRPFRHPAAVHLPRTMEDLLFPPATTYSSPPPPLACPLSWPAAVAARVLSAESVPAAVSHEAVAGECVVGGVAVGAPEATIAPPAAYTGDRYDISRIELSPSVDVQVAGQWERTQHMNEDVKRDGGELAESGVVAVLEPPALSPEPHIGSVLDSFQQQRSEYALSGDAPLNRTPLHSPPVEEQPQQQQQLDTHDNSDEGKAVDDSFTSPLPLRRTDPQLAVMAPYMSAEQQQHAHMAAHARTSAYTYSQPAPQPYGRATQSSAQRGTDYAPHYAAVPIAYQRSYQAQPAMHPAMHHPSVPYYHTADNNMPAQSQPTAAHLHSLHSYIHRHRQLELQRNEIVSRYTQLEATKDQRPAQDHALLVQHLEHCHQQVQADMQSTAWMVGGGAPLITTADVPRIQSYSHAEQVRHHRQPRAAEAATEAAARRRRRPAGGRVQRG